MAQAAPVHVHAPDMPSMHRLPRRFYNNQLQAGPHLLEAALHKALEVRAEVPLQPGRGVLGNQEERPHGVQLSVGGRSCRHLQRFTQFIMCSLFEKSVGA